MYAFLSFFSRMKIKATIGMIYSNQNFKIIFASGFWEETRPRRPISLLFQHPHHLPNRQLRVREIPQRVHRHHAIKRVFFVHLVAILNVPDPYTSPSRLDSSRSPRESSLSTDLNLRTPRISRNTFSKPVEWKFQTRTRRLTLSRVIVSSTSSALASANTRCHLTKSKGSMKS